MDIPNSQIIKFDEDDQVQLKFVGEENGVYKYETSYYNPDSLNNGESVRIIIRMEQYYLEEKQKLPKKKNENKIF